VRVSERAAEDRLAQARAATGRARDARAADARAVDRARGDGSAEPGVAGSFAEALRRAGRVGGATPDGAGQPSKGYEQAVAAADLARRGGPGRGRGDAGRSPGSGTGGDGDGGAERPILSTATATSGTAAPGALGEAALPSPDLAAAVRAVPPAVVAFRLGGREAVALDFGAALGLVLRREPGGVALTLAVVPGLAAAARAELPGLLRALAGRGVAVVRAEVSQGRQALPGGQPEPGR
jgi:hypothetical protein